MKRDHRTDLCDHTCYMADGVTTQWCRHCEEGCVICGILTIEQGQELCQECEDIRKTA